MRTIRWIRSTIIAFALVLGAGVAMAGMTEDPVALLVKLQGGVTVERAGQPAAESGAVGMQLNVGDRVVVAEGGEAVVLYRSGKLVKAAAPVTIEQPAGTENSSLFANTVRTLGQVATTDARTQPNRQGMIRPIAGAPVPVAPRNGIRVMDVRPTFVWTGVEGARGYMIQVQREGPDAPRPVRFNAGLDTVWTWPRTEAPLLPGATYVWTVGGEGIGRVAEPQRFTVASSKDMAAVEQTLTALTEAGIDPAVDGLFLAALAYRDAGLFYEALGALDRIEAQGNASGPAFHMLRGEVYDAIGDGPGAEAAFRRADHAHEDRT